MKQRAFTLMELMIVIVIIGILSAVGMVMFGGQAEKAKIAATKANHKLVKKYIIIEVTKCELGETTVMNGKLTCSGRTASDVISAAISELSNFKNSHSTTNNAVRNASSKDDVDVGFVNLNLDRTFIAMITCFKTPCSNSKNKLSIVLTVVD